QFRTNREMDICPRVTGPTQSRPYDPRAPLFQPQPPSAAGSITAPVRTQASAGAPPQSATPYGLRWGFFSAVTHVQTEKMKQKAGRERKQIQVSLTSNPSGQMMC